MSRKSYFLYNHKQSMYIQHNLVPPFELPETYYHPVGYVFSSKKNYITCLQKKTNSELNSLYYNEIFCYLGRREIMQRLNFVKRKDWIMVRWRIFCEASTINFEMQKNEYKKLKNDFEVAIFDEIKLCRYFVICEESIKIRNDKIMINIDYMNKKKEKKISMDVYTVHDPKKHIFVDLTPIETKEVQQKLYDASQKMSNFHISRFFSRKFSDYQPEKYEDDLKIRETDNEIFDTFFTTNNQFNLFVYLETNIIKLLKEYYDTSLLKLYIILYENICKKTHNFTNICLIKLFCKISFILDETYLQKLTYEQLTDLKSIFYKNELLDEYLNFRNIKLNNILKHYKEYKNIKVLVHYCERKYNKKLYEYLKKKNSYTDIMYGIENAQKSVGYLTQKHKKYNLDTNHIKFDNRRNLSQKIAIHRNNHFLTWAKTLLKKQKNLDLDIEKKV